MKRRDALVGLPAVMYAAACHADQDKPTPPPGTGYPKTPPPGEPPAGIVRTTERVRIALKGGTLDVKPPIAVLFARKAGRPASSLKWEIDIPANYSLEINFAVDYEGEVHASLKKDALPKRGPFDRAKNEVRGRYVTRGPALGEGALDSGPVDVTEESYWKYEVTVTGPEGTPVLVVDPGTIIKEGEV